MKNRKNRKKVLLMTIRELVEYTKSNNKPFLGEISLDLFPFAKEYVDNYSLYDKWIADQFGSWVYCYDGFTKDDTLIEFQNGVWADLYINTYMLKSLYETTMYEYDPIANYDRKEKTTETRTPNLKRDSNDTNKYGAKKTSYDNTGEVAPFDSSTQSPYNHDYGTNSSEAFNDSHTSSETETGNETTVRESTITGNIGVTTTQEMIMSQRNVAYFSFFKVMWEVIRKDYFLYVGSC